MTEDIIIACNGKGKGTSRSQWTLGHWPSVTE